MKTLLWPCVCMYIYIYIHTCIFMYICAYLCMCIHTYHIYTCVCVHMCVCMCVCACVRASACAPCEAVLNETVFHDISVSTWQLKQYLDKADYQKCPPSTVVHSLDCPTCHPSVTYPLQHLVLNCSPHCI